MTTLYYCQLSRTSRNSSIYYVIMNGDRKIDEDILEGSPAQVDNQFRWVKGLYSSERNFSIIETDVPDAV